MSNQLAAAREEFVAQWGTMGSVWGINRTMAQVHALLMISDRPLHTDEIMKELSISRGSANTSLRELVNWGVARSVIMKGERKEHFESERDVWRMFCAIARERKRREIEPVIKALESCREQTDSLKSADAVAFNKTVSELLDFVSIISSALDRIGRSEQSTILPMLLKFLK
ncbi:putative transcriptional regulator [Opitutaceae bacterium TAV1]|nr:transcriptional regulator [Opitutaceae bacterium TAV5]EIP96992.1 putative transcriptional regulator [Opitutaceae bacterium TAV1]